MRTVEFGFQQMPGKGFYLTKTVREEVGPSSIQVAVPLHPRPFQQRASMSSMPLRPFPLPIGIGTDICAINRVRAIIGKGDNNFRRYLRRFLTPREQRSILRHYGNADLTDYQVRERLSHLLAGRYVSFMAAL